jgi:hypothetical protein
MPTKATALREEAARIKAEAERMEAKERLDARMKDAARIPTCPNCGGRRFKVDAWTIVSQSILFPEPEDGEEQVDDTITKDDYDWDDDYQSGDHTELYESASCNACGADVQDVLEAHGWTFYDDPKTR